MAVETVTIGLGETWTLVSNTNTGVFQYESGSDSRVLIFIGDTAPAATEPGISDPEATYETLGSAKVYARAPSGSGKITVVRTVDAANPAVVANLSALSLSTFNFSSALAFGAVVATITGKTAGSVVRVVEPNSPFFVSDDGTQLLMGSSKKRQGYTYECTLVERLPAARNSPRYTGLVVSASAIASLGTLTVASPTFAPGAAAGTVIAVIAGKTAGSTIRVVPDDGRLAVSSDGTQLLVGLSASSAGFIDATLIETLDGSPNSPVRKAISVQVAAPVVPVPGGLMLRATNLGSSIMEQGQRGGAVVTSMARRPVKLPVMIRRAKVLVPMFSVVTGGSVAPSNGTGLTDAFFTTLRSFQRGINPVWNPDHAAAPTGRRLFTFSGQKTVTYDPATWDTSKVFAESDWLEDLNIPADTDFEWSNAVRAPAGNVPYTQTHSGDKQPGHAVLNSVTDNMGTNGLETTTGFVILANSPSGGTFFDNAIMIVETTDNVVQVLSVGDSNVYAFGYDKGDSYGIAGALARGTQNRKGWMAVTLGRGSDGDFSSKVAAYTAKRRQLAADIHAMSAFQARFHAHGGNDVTKTYTAVATYANSLPRLRGDVVLSPGAGVYICTKAGTSKASGTLTGAGRNIVDGDAEWAQLSAAGGGLDQQVGQMVAAKMLAMDHWRSSLPGVPVYDVTIVPQTTTTDQWLTVAGQTANTTLSGWGSSTSRRGRLNAHARAKLDLYQTAGVMDVNRYIESGYIAGLPATDTSIWLADGVTVNFYTPDGTHFSDKSAIEASRAIDGIFIMAPGGVFNFPKFRTLETFDGPIGNYVLSNVNSPAIVASPRILGSGALKGECVGTAATQGFVTRLNAFSADLSTLGVIAIPMWIGNRGGHSTFLAQFGRGNTGYAGVSVAYPGNDRALGWYWYAINVRDIVGLPTGFGLNDLRFRVASNAPNATKFAYDEVRANARGRAKVTLNHDDVFSTFMTNAKPVLDSRGVKGNFYVYPDGVLGIGQNGRMTWADVRQLDAELHDICCAGTLTDASMTGAGTVVAARLGLEAVRTSILGNGVSNRAVDHFYYPNAHYQGNASGATAIPVQIAAATSDGSNVVVFGAPVTVQDGWDYDGTNVPLNTVIVSGGGTNVTSVTVSSAIPAQTKPAVAIDMTGPFEKGRLQKELRDNSTFKNGRSAGSGLVPCDRFGYGDQRLTQQGIGLTGATQATINGHLDTIENTGGTAHFVFHSVVPDGTTPLGLNIEVSTYAYLIDQCLARNIEIMTMSKYDDFVMANSVPLSLSPPVV